MVSSFVGGIPSPLLQHLEALLNDVCTMRADQGDYTKNQPHDKGRWGVKAPKIVQTKVYSNTFTLVKKALQ